MKKTEIFISDGQLDSMYEANEDVRHASRKIEDLIEEYCSANQTPEFIVEMRNQINQISKELGNLDAILSDIDFQLAQINEMMYD